MQVNLAIFTTPCLELATIPINALNRSHNTGHLTAKQNLCNSISPQSELLWTFRSQHENHMLNCIKYI
ncbi:hypothetical protein LguiA_015663 [Lonicera macranthoides]